MSSTTMAGTRNPGVQKKESDWRRNSGDPDICNQNHSFKKKCTLGEMKMVNEDGQRMFVTSCDMTDQTVVKVRNGPHDSEGAK